ncbi:hypothetical protein [Microbacterium sp. T32]|uniref:hypothetical protein n=1 Tax=Microbacterium sp. T32 TaxID=1776083 RepID=UPI0007AB3648|nr:hypothetical protein [Microbacterium sp. T32]KZE41356.1 hypothetical protein AVW09_01870 [Microbacterium sp. T32]
MSAAIDAPPRFRLVAQKRGAKWGRSPLTGKRELIRDPERFAALPDIPPGFAEREGTYPEVAHLASQANKGQLENWDGKGERLDYLFSPEMAAEKGDVAA